MEQNIFEYERIKAVNILVKLGAVKYVKDTVLYHGRAGDGNKFVTGANDQFTQSFIINDRRMPRIKVFEDEGK